LSTIAKDPPAKSRNKLVNLPASASFIDELGAVVTGVSLGNGSTAVDRHREVVRADGHCIVPMPIVAVI
jgi:hypothetical protein